MIGTRRTGILYHLRKSPKSRVGTGRYHAELTWWGPSDAFFGRKWNGNSSDAISVEGKDETNSYTRNNEHEAGPRPQIELPWDLA